MIEYGIYNMDFIIVTKDIGTINLLTLICYNYLLICIFSSACLYVPFLHNVITYIYTVLLSVIGLTAVDSAHK
jgi:hypothetical protein